MTGVMTWLDQNLNETLDGVQIRAKPSDGVNGMLATLAGLDGAFAMLALSIKDMVRLSVYLQSDLQRERENAEEDGDEQWIDVVNVISGILQEMKRQVDSQFEVVGYEQRFGGRR